MTCAGRRPADAAARSGDELLVPMVHGSVAWAYQRQNRLDDAEELAVTAADSLENGSLDSAARIRVWGGLLMSAATRRGRLAAKDRTFRPWHSRQPPREPSEAELMAEFEIGRTTARRAVAWLRKTGLVETLPGRGTYVL